MSAHRRLGVPPRGFTLVEIVVCIVLAAIVASFIVLFVGAPVQEYFQQTSRASLIDSADRAASAVTADARMALPNSMRVASTARYMGLELLQTEGTARYYGAGENLSSSEDLTPGVATSSFGTVDSFGGTAAANLSVGNLGTLNHDAYANASGIMTPKRTTVTVNLTPPAPLVPGENQVTLSAQMDFTPDGLPTPVHNAYLVQGPVSYVCDTQKETLTRYSGYAVTAAQRLPPAGGTSALIAQNVSTCTFNVYQDSPRLPAVAGYRFGEVAILDVTLSSGGETFQLFVEAPTEYNR